jgi:tetratricopeptide (TPR) repeat protein
MIGLVAAKQKNYEEAIKQCENALRIRQKVFGKDSPTVAESYNSLSVIYRNMGNNDKAEKYKKKVTDILPDLYEKINDLSMPSLNDELGKYVFYKVRLFYL